MGYNTTLRSVADVGEDEFPPRSTVRAVQIRSDRLHVPRTARSWTPCLLACPARSRGLSTPRPPQRVSSTDAITRRGHTPSLVQCDAERQTHRDLVRLEPIEQDPQPTMLGVETNVSESRPACGAAAPRSRWLRRPVAHRCPSADRCTPPAAVGGVRGPPDGHPPPVQGPRSGCRGSYAWGHPITDPAADTSSLPVSGGVRRVGPAPPHPRQTTLSMLESGLTHKGSGSPCRPRPTLGSVYLLTNDALVPTVAVASRFTPGSMPQRHLCSDW